MFGVNYFEENYLCGNSYSKRNNHCLNQLKYLG